MTKPGHSEAEDAMEGAFAWIVVVVLTVVGLLSWGAYALISHILKAAH